MEINTQQLTLEVIDEAFVFILATHDEDGVWTAPLTHVRVGTELWWVSEPSARHSRAVEKNPRVSCALVARHAVDDERALQIEGTVEIVHGTKPELEELLATKRGIPVEKERKEIRNGSYLWYRLIPTKIGLIYGKHFGYEVKNVPL